MSRVLIIIVSVGYGVVKPRLGETLSKVFNNFFLKIDDIYFAGLDRGRDLLHFLRD